MPLLDRARSALVVIDVQERYLPHLFEGARMVEGVRRLIEGAKRVDVPILLTEQYPRGLGHTAAVVREALPTACAAIEKSSLSCLGEPAFAARLRETGRTQVVVAGIEAHACVNQTAHELLEQGFEVHLAIDAVTARFRRDYETALARLERAGAIPTTVEAVLLEWVRTAESPEFQAMRALIRDPLPEGDVPAR